MPPLHPAFVHFPIALVVFSFVADLLGRWTKRSSLRAAGFWSLIGALLMGAITAATGYYDFTRAALGETARYADFHQDIGFVLVGCVVVLTIWRWLAYARRDVSPGLVFNRRLVGSWYHAIPGLVRRRNGLLTGCGSGGSWQRN